ncbi:hypothetical protein [Novipirellula artificiosorum]|uniref:Uncharacterized protein n=1 Tax=Novipirellula artificiosorum TaxID=2528016 RepID=A0A5C6DQZ9_9BACT|nr:hypothetical protein [Novipirellula artificiosorum]TWU38635.1 hypothetical protein Poly41_31120 [Novipirellula artificiosorum]
MNQSTGERLIDEHEIRAALRPWRPDRQSFADGVRNRVELVVKRRSDAHLNDSASASDPRPSEWLRIAASFVPIHLLGRSFDTSVAPISFAAISLGKKMVVVLAFPFLCFLMIGLTVIGMMRIRALQHEQGSASIDIEQARQATAQWWKRYGWIAAIVFTAALVAPFLGWSMPLMVALVCSGFATVSLVRTLAKENLIDRAVVGGSCVAGLGILGQLSATFASMSSSQLLDPYLVTGVLFSGSFMIGALVRPSSWTGQGVEHRLSKQTKMVLLVTFAISNIALACLAYRLASYWLLILIAMGVTVAASLLATPRVRKSMSSLWVIGGVLLGCLIMTVCSKSYWGGVTSADLRLYVESYDGQRMGLWDDWADVAQMLDETDVGFDKELVLKRFQQDLKLHPQMRDRMLTAAARSGLISDSELLAYLDVQADRRQLTDSTNSDQPILNVNTVYFRIVALAFSNDFTETERDVLTGRLMADWNRLASKDFEYRKLADVLLISELIERLDRTTERERRIADVHRWLVEYQVTEPHAFRSIGGFRAFMQTNESDRQATVAAISLMEIFGTPRELDLTRLRSYLRPNALHDLQAYNYVPKVVAREKLVRLAGVPPLTVSDYLRSELPLWLSIMLVLLLAYATFSSPNRALHAPKRLRRTSAAGANQ